MNKTAFPKTNVQRLREEKGWTQEELARRAKVSRGTISRWERKVTTDPTGITAQSIAKALGVPVTTIEKDMPRTNSEGEPVKGRGRPAKPKPSGVFYLSGSFEIRPVAPGSEIRFEKEGESE